MDAKKFRTTLFFIMLTVSLGFCFTLFFPFLQIIAWASLLAIVAYPIHRRILLVIRKPTIAALISCILIIFIVVVPVIFIVSGAINEGITLGRKVQALAQEGELIEINELLNVPIISSISNFVKQHTNLSGSDLETLAMQKIEQLSSSFIQKGTLIVKDFIWNIVGVVIAIMTFFFMLKDSSKLVPAVRVFIPLDTVQTDMLLSRIGNTMHLTVYLALVIALVQGMLGGIAFFFLGLPSPLFWGTAMVVLGMIPFLGAPIIWIPAAIILVIKGIYWKAIILVLWGMFVIGLIDNLIRALVIGERIQLHPIVVFFTVFGGVLLMGPIGLFMGPVVLTLTIALLDILKLKLQEQKPT